MQNLLYRRVSLISPIASLLVSLLLTGNVLGQPQAGLEKDTVATYSGSGQVTTEPFSISGSWKVKWQSTAEVFFLNGFEAGNPNSTYPSQIAGPNAPSTGSSYVERGGRYYFKVISSGAWKLQVIQEKRTKSAGSTSVKQYESGREQAEPEAIYTSPDPEENDSFGETVVEVNEATTNNIPDLLIGTWGKSDVLDGEGEAYVISGSDGMVLQTLNSPNPEEYGFFGASGTGVGDINGDGIPDLLVGAWSEDYGETPNAGKTYLISGKDGQEVRTLTSPEPESGGSFGDSVARIGDTNGDGNPEVAVSAPNESSTGIEGAGQVYLINTADGQILHRVTSENPSENGGFGMSVGGGKDVDGDDIPDLLVSAPTESVDGIEEAGRIYLINGSSGRTIRDFSSPNPKEGGWFGVSSAMIEDVNGDGVPDLLVGAMYESHQGMKKAGHAYLISGGDGQLLHELTSPNSERKGRFGSSVTGVRDIDGDEVPELLVGAKGESPYERKEAGRAYLISGARGKVLRTLTSPNAETEGLFGSSVATTKDRQIKTTPDLLVGAISETVEGTQGAGRVYRFETRILLERKASRLLSKNHPDLVKPKGEFETTKNYQKRKKRAQAKENEILKDLKKKRQRKVEESLTSATLSLQSVGRYNADDNFFPVTIRGKDFRLEIPLNEARSFDKNWKDAKVVGRKQLKEDLSEYRYFDLEVIHPLTEKHYPVNPKSDSSQ